MISLSGLGAGVGLLLGIGWSQSHIGPLVVLVCLGVPEEDTNQLGVDVTINLDMG